MHAFTRTVLSDDASAVEINFARYSLDQRLRAGHNRGDLQGPLQEALEKKNAHRECEWFTAAFRLSSNESGYGSGTPHRNPCPRGEESAFPRHYPGNAP